MDFRPGKARNNSKLTEKYIAGRGRALKEFSRISPKAEEVERRKQVQQLILSGQVQIMLDKETVVKCLGGGKNGSTCDSASSSSSQLQMEDTEIDSCMDLMSETNCSKAPVGSTQWQREVQTEPVFHNDLENHMDKLNITDNSEDAASNIPPRFRNSHWGKHFKKQKQWPKSPKKNDNEKQFKEEASGSRDQPRKLEPSPAMVTQCNTQKDQTSSDPWDDWEMSVIAQPHVIDDEDLDEIVAIDDNDNIDDVMVQQYINALHQENESSASNATSSKVTPSRIQALGNLKSTTNADSVKVPPGTIPNPPKGPDRWGGSELKDIDSPTGWGDLVEETGNWYDDGSTLWSNPYGASGGWSWNS